MQGLAVLIFVGGLVSTPWAMIVVAGVILGGFALVAWVWVRQDLEIEPAASPWRRVEPRFEPWTFQEELSDRSRLKRRIEQLERDLRSSKSKVTALQSRAEQLERDLQTARTAQPKERANPLFRRVGLDESAPEWVVAAVRRAYRSHLHPDRYPARLKPEAERRFKDAENVFDLICKERGMAS